MAQDGAFGPIHYQQYAPLVALHHIPVLSVADWRGPDAEPEAFADELRSVCHELGFLQIVDHGVDRDFLDEYFTALRAFFALPEETKASIDKSRSPWFRGWERLVAWLASV